MAKRLEIIIGDEVFFANMLEKKAPKTCEAVLDLLPLKGKVFHATWSGDMLFFKCLEIPVETDQENQTIYPSQGDVGLNFNLKEFQIVYGQAQLRARFGPAPDNLFAKITENLSGLEEMGKRIHREGPKKIAIKLRP